MKIKNFPRLELKYPKIICRVAATQHLQYLIDYLEGKWLKGISTQHLQLYPDLELYLKKIKGKADNEPLSPYLMMTDLLCAYDWPKDNILTLFYDVTEEGTEKMKASQAKKKSK